MSIQFNPDGSIKLPTIVAQEHAEDERRMRTGRCITVRKEVVSERAPKRCLLHITLSPQLAAENAVERIHGFFKRDAETPTKLTQLSSTEFEIEIGTAFRRCSDCTTLISRLREAVDGNLILRTGNCTYGEKRNANWCEEDYL